MKTAQEIFDTVVVALRKQNNHSKDNYTHVDPFNGAKKSLSICMLRNSKGLKCAVGHLIPDDIYKVGMEGNCAFFLHPFLDALFGRENLSLVSDLQIAHDCHEIEQWEGVWDRVATHYKLVKIAK